MADNKVFYWLKLKEDFFEDDTIRWMEEQENGKEYTLFYLKLCLKSLNLDGTIIRIVGEKLIPYDKKALARLTNTDIDTVTIAMNLFKEIGLVDIFDTGEIYMKQVKEMTGSRTEGAIRKEKYRKGIEEKKRDNVPRLSQECPTENREESLEFRDKSLEKKNTSSSLDDLFSQVWKLYPKKTARKEALAAFKKYMKTEDSDINVVIDGINRYNRYLQENSSWLKPMDGGRWFQKERWADDYELNQPDAKPWTFEKTEEEKQLDELSRKRLEGVEIGSDDDFF